MANAGLSLEIHFSVFYHFHHGLLCWSMDRHGCPDFGSQVVHRMDSIHGRPREYPVNVKKEHHLVHINIQFGVSQSDLQWHTQGKVQNERLKIQIGDNGQNSESTKSMIWIPGYFIVKLLKSPGASISQVCMRSIDLLIKKPPSLTVS